MSVSLIIAFTSQRFNYFYDIEALRTLVYTTSATNARVQSVVLRRIIHKLVHKSLTESLHLRRTAVAVCHQREIRIHAGIPATITNNPFTRFEITNVEALTGRANKGTSTAAQASLAHFFPFLCFKELVKVFGLKLAQIQRREG